jgi:hypothetical protein
MGLVTRVFASIALAFALAAGPCAHAGDVYFAGIAMLGDGATLERNYPYATAFNRRAGAQPGALDSELGARARTLVNPGFTLKFDELGTLDPGASSIALALAIDRETVSVEEIGGLHKILVEVGGQALFFDFRENAVIATYPLSVPYKDITSTPPSAAQIAAVVREAYTGKIEDGNLLEHFAAAVAAASPNREVSRRIQIVDVAIEDDARGALPSHLAANERILKNSLAQEFGKWLSSSQRIPILPYTVDYAIANRMATRFANGSVFELQLPETDYAIRLSLAKLKRLEFAQVAAGRSLVYGAYLHVKAAEPLSNTVYVDATFKNGESKIVPASQTNVDDWAAYQETLSLLILEMMKALQAPSADWAKKHAGDPALVKDLKSFQKVLQSCR